MCLSMKEKLCYMMEKEEAKKYAECLHMKKEQIKKKYPEIIDSGNMYFAQSIESEENSKIDAAGVAILFPKEEEEYPVLAEFVQLYDDNNSLQTIITKRHDHEFVSDIYDLHNYETEISYDGETFAFDFWDV